MRVGRGGVCPPEYVIKLQIARIHTDYYFLARNSRETLMPLLNNNPCRSAFSVTSVPKNTNLRESAGFAGVIQKRADTMVCPAFIIHNLSFLITYYFLYDSANSLEMELFRLWQTCEARSMPHWTTRFHFSSLRLGRSSRRMFSFRSP